MLLCGINYNIIIHRLSHLGVYQYEGGMRALQRDKYVLGWSQTKKNDKMLVHISPSALVFKILPTKFLNGC